MAAGGSDDVNVPSQLGEVFAQLDQKGSMDWRYLASQFSLTAEEIRSLGKQDSPTQALIGVLRAKGVQFQEISETCHRSGLKKASSIIETYSQRIGTRGDSACVKADGCDADADSAHSKQWPSKWAVGVTVRTAGRAVEL